MSYQTEAAAIRKKLSSYTTYSLVRHLLANLHQPQGKVPNGIQVPWIHCLTLEWTLEIDERPNAVEASAKCVGAILNRVWALQNSALTLDRVEDPMMEIRRMLIPQARFQQEQKSHLIFLFRFIAIIELQAGKKTLRSQFEHKAGISLDKFLLFASWLWISLPFSKQYFVSYETLINQLYPALQPFEIIHLLKLVGGTIPEIKKVIQTIRPTTRHLNPSEYFDEPALVVKPVFLLGDGISTPQAHLLSIGLSEFVMRTLKAGNPGLFKDTFTKLYEAYMAKLLSHYNLTLQRESAIEAWYKKAGLSGKVADFLVKDGTSTILIDAKGVEPKTSMLTSGTASYIKDKLKDSLIKGVIQIAECAGILTSLGQISPDLEGRYGLVVTHQEHYISDAEKLFTLCEGSSVELRAFVEGKLLSKNILFCTISDLEKMLNICDATKTSLSDLLKFSAERQADIKTRRFIFEQHVHEYHQHHGSPNFKATNEMILSQSDRYFAECHNAVEQSHEYWRSKGEFSIQEFIDTYITIKNKLGVL